MPEAHPGLFGRYQAAESPSSLYRLHLHTGGPLKEMDDEPKIGVLDQEDLFKQGIDTSQLIQGAPKVDALGSCTAQATMAHLSCILPQEEFLGLLGKLSGFVGDSASGYDDVVTVEKAAIWFYHLCSFQTGDPAQEWPLVDCGSSGPFIYEFLLRLGLVKNEQIAQGPQNIVSLMQNGGLLLGSPYFQSWMEPDAQGFVDGDGSVEALQAAINSGLAGGHETRPSAIEKLTLTETGLVVPEKTVIRIRNSWDKSFGDNGSFRMHLSTLAALGSHCDLRQPVAA